MLKNIRLGVKLAGGFGLVLVIALAVSLLNLVSVRRLGTHLQLVGGASLPSIQSLGVLAKEANVIRTAQRSLLIPYLSAEDRARQYDNIEASRARYQAAWALYEKLPKSPVEQDIWSRLVSAWEAWRATNDELERRAREIEATSIPSADAFAALINLVIADHHQTVTKVEYLLLSGATFEGGTDPTQCRLGRWMAAGTTGNTAIDNAVQALKPDHDVFHLGISRLKSQAAAGRARDALGTLTAVVMPSRDALLEQLALITAESNRVVGLLGDAFEYSMTVQKTAQDQAIGLLDELGAAGGTAASAALADAASDSARARIVGLAGMGVAAALVVALSVTLTLGITRPILTGVEFARQISRGNLDLELSVRGKDEVGQLADSLRAMLAELRYKAELLEKVARGDLTSDVRLASEADGLGTSLSTMSGSLNRLLGQVTSAVEQVTAGASQISQASQTLSQGAAEQASSLEEVSASLTQIGAQTRSNAESAAEASAQARQAMETARAGDAQMAGLTAAMGRISASSAEIRKVVKLIDDIAFQINLLALNANVEAARAGKYGKGFAVVAEEVRSLAARSAQAVKETSTMVEQSTAGIREGENAVRATAEHLAGIVKASSRVADLLSEISAASNEQRQGVDQISTGLSQIDQVTQGNTASAEETASAAEELAAQALQLKTMISQFRLRNGDGEMDIVPAASGGEVPRGVLAAH